MVMVSGKANGLGTSEVRHSVDHADAIATLAGHLRVDATRPEAIFRECLEAMDASGNRRIDGSSEHDIGMEKHSNVRLMIFQITSIDNWSRKYRSMRKIKLCLAIVL